MTKAPRGQPYRTRRRRYSRRACKQVPTVRLWRGEKSTTSTLYSIYRVHINVFSDIQHRRATERWWVGGSEVGGNRVGALPKEQGMTFLTFFLQLGVWSDRQTA